jgi:hypothetical protein
VLAVRMDKRFLREELRKYLRRKINKMPEVNQASESGDLLLS